MRRVYRYGIVVAALAALSGAVGCSGPADEQADRSSTVPVSQLSAPVRAAVEIQQRLNTEPLPAPPGAREVQAYFRLRQDLLIPERRTAAAETLWARWNREPDDLILMEAAWFRRAYLGGDARVVARFEELMAADSTSAAALFARARMNWSRPQERRRLFGAAGAGADLRPVQRSWLELRLALAESADQNHDAAVDRLTGSLAAAWSSGGAPLAACWWRDISTYALRAGRLDDALAAALLAVAVARAGGDPLLETRGQLALGAVLTARGEYAEAAAIYAACETRATELGFARWIRDAQEALYEVRRARGDRQACLAVARRSYARAMAMEDTVRAIAACVLAGNDHRLLGRTDSMEVWLTRAQRLDGIGTPQGQEGAIAIIRMSHALQVGDYARADSIRTVMGASLPPNYQAVRLFDIIAEGIERGLPAQAYAGLQEARQLEPLLTATDAYDPVLVLAHLSARFHATQGEFALAGVDLARAAERIATGRPPIDQWDHAQVAGEIADLAGDLDTAAERYAAALDIATERSFPDLASRSRVRLGRVLAAQGRFDDARDLFEATRAAPEYWTRLATALSLGEIEAAAGRPGVALERLAQADSLLRPDSPRDLVAQLRLGQSRALAALGRPADAFAALQKVDLGSGVGESPDDAAIVLAFRRPLHQDVAETGIGLVHDHPALAAEFGAAATALAMAENARWRLDPAGPEPDARTIANLRVPRGAVVAAFFVGEARAFAWVNAGRRWSLRELTDLDRLRDRILAVGTDTEAPDRPVDPRALRELSAALLGPALAVWQGEQPLYIVASGSLEGLPWPALPVSDRATVVDRGPVVVLAALGGFDRVASAREPRGGRLLAVGVDDATDTARLRQAEAEARAVGAAWLGAVSTVVTGDQARWSALRDRDLAAYAVIHVASHATITQGLPGRSTLRLAGDDATPVTIPEVRDLSLGADLVYLSCCDGARRSGGTGTGIDSFTRAFLQAGAHSVVAVTHPVQDEAARFLAERFYQHWQAGMSKAAALQAAQLDVRDARRPWSHPFYWAHYQLHAAGLDGD